MDGDSPPITVIIKAYKLLERWDKVYVRGKKGHLMTNTCDFLIK